MSTKEKKTRRNKRILISTAAIFIVLIAALAYISNLNQPRARADTYFTISDLAGIYQTTGGTSIKIVQFEFTFTPTGGDATGLRMFAKGFLNPLTNNWENETIRKGMATDSGSMEPAAAIFSYYDRSKADYNMSIRFACTEVDGYILLNFTAADGIITGT